MHDDHTPSLKFTPSKNMFFCFVCDKGGGPIQLVMDYEKWEFQEACLWLIKEFNIIIPEDKRYVKPAKKTVKKVYLSKNDAAVYSLDEEILRWLVSCL